VTCPCEGLSGTEVEARLRQRGIPPAEAAHLVDHRDDEDWHRAIDAIIGDGE
jgi:hypothetical protein